MARALIRIVDVSKTFLSGLSKYHRLVIRYHKIYVFLLMMDGEEDDLGQDDDDEDQVEQSHHKIILCLATLTT